MGLRLKKAIQLFMIRYFPVFIVQAFALALTDKMSNAARAVLLGVAMAIFTIIIIVGNMHRDAMSKDDISRDEFERVIGEIMVQGDMLQKTAGLLNTMTENANQTIEQVESIVEEMAQNTALQANDTVHAAESVSKIGGLMGVITADIGKLHATSTRMAGVAASAKEVLESLEIINGYVQDAINIIYDQTNMTHEASLQIKAATEVISSIARETNILSLNASIEAARAGENGTGFAVVAESIGKLAAQSNNSAKEIKDITNALITESEKAVETMQKLKDISATQNGHVQKTQEIFAIVNDGLAESNTLVDEIAVQSKDIDKERNSVVSIVQDLSAIAEENASGTEEAAASVTKVSALMQSITESTTGVTKTAAQLKKNITFFKQT